MELNSTLGSDVSGNEAQLKNTSREDSDQEGDPRTPCSSLDELTITRSFAEVVKGTPPQSSLDESDPKEEKIKQVPLTFQIAFT